MKKLKKSVVFVVVASIFAGFGVSAEIVKRFTNHSYLEHTHPHWAYYVGYASVRGIDWIPNGDSRWSYLLFSRLTYDVPERGDTVIQATSLGENDQVVRKNSKQVGDTLNPVASKTQYYWRVDRKNRSNQTIAPSRSLLD